MDLLSVIKVYVNRQNYPKFKAKQGKAMHTVRRERLFKHNASKVLVDQVEAMEAVSIGGILGTANVAILSAWLCRDSPNHEWIIAWLVLKLFLCVGMIWAELRQYRVSLSEANAQQRLQRLTFFPAINGVMWAAGVLLMWEAGNLETQLILMLFTVAMGAAALLELKPHLPALFLFFIPSSTAFIAAAVWKHDQNTVFVIMSGMIFIVWSVRHAFTEHHRIIRSLYKKYEVADLTIQLQEQIVIAEEATQAKSRFLAAASHDLRQPMHALNLYLGALANFNLPNAAEPVLGRVRECAKTMDDMFAALLDISRLDASTLEANFTTFPVLTILNKIYVEFSHQAEAKGLVLRVVPCSEFITSDAELLENILRNLVSNAIRYTDRGKILVGCRRTMYGIRLGVYDTGIGIASNMQPAIFQEFFQVGNRQRDRSQGLGLGLAIAQRQARLMQTEITLLSKLGGGSAFQLELKRSSLKLVHEKKRIDQPSNTHSLSGALIVVIDDEKIILEATSMLLKQWGCEVVLALSGEEVLQNIVTITRVPDAIVCDHRLQDGRSGIDLVSALRHEFYSDIPAVLITGDTSPDQIQSIVNAGFPVMHKPLQSNVLQKLLSDLIFGTELKKA